MQVFLFEACEFGAEARELHREPGVLRLEIAHTRLYPVGLALALGYRISGLLPAGEELLELMHEFLFGLLALVQFCLDAIDVFLHSLLLVGELLRLALLLLEDLLGALGLRTQHALYLGVVRPYLRLQVAQVVFRGLFLLLEAGELREHFGASQLRYLVAQLLLTDLERSELAVRGAHFHDDIVDPALEFLALVVQALLLLLVQLEVLAVDVQCLLERDDLAFEVRLVLAQTVDDLLVHATAVLDPCQGAVDIVEFFLEAFYLVGQLFLLEAHAGARFRTETAGHRSADLYEVSCERDHADAADAYLARGLERVHDERVAEHVAEDDVVLVVVLDEFRGHADDAGRLEEFVRVRVELRRFEFRDGEECRDAELVAAQERDAFARGSIVFDDDAVDAACRRDLER